MEERRVETRCGVAAMLLLLAFPAMAAERCPPVGTAQPRREVTLTASTAPVVYRNDQSRAQITALAGRQNVPLHIFNTGLTRHHTEFRVSPEFWWVELGKGRRCIGIGRVEAKWAISETIVDVAAEYRPGSCEYRAVREHEEEHVTLTKRAFDTIAPRMKARLDTLVARVEPFVTELSADDAGNQLLKSLMDGTKGVLDEQERLRHDLNAAIDTPESYRRTTALCRNW